MLNNKGQTDLWGGSRLPALWSWLIVLVIILGSIRGLIVINSNIPAGMVYKATSLFLIILSVYGCIKSYGYRNHDLGLLKSLIKLNMLLGVFNVVVDLLLGVAFDPSVLYFYLAPYVVFLLLRVPAYYLNVAVTVITIGISYSVADNFIETMKGPEGYQRVFDYNLKLRPDSFEALTKTGEYYRAAGYTGSYHDSANILGMVAPFLFIRFLLRKKSLDLGLFLFATVGLTLTQSAANIIIAIFTILLFAGYIVLRSRKKTTYAYLLLGVVGIAVLIAAFGDVMSIFTARVGKGGDWEGMVRSLDLDLFLSALPFFLVGHAAAFSSKIIQVEVSHLKIVFQIGIIHATILFWILLYPLLRFVKVRSRCSDALPSAAAIFFGFMSLLHYGSLFRITSIFLFYMFYVICLINIINCRNPISLPQSHGHDVIGPNRR